MIGYFLARGLVVEGTKGRGRSRKPWEHCVRNHMTLQCFAMTLSGNVFRDMWRE